MRYSRGLEDLIMSFRIPNRLLLAILFVQAFSLAAAQAQSQNSTAPSVADAAKQAREQKKNAASAAKIITDDDIDAKSVKPGAEGLTVSGAPELDTQGPSAAAVAAQEAADQRRDLSPADDPLKKTDPAKVAKLKEELAQAEEDLKLSQRENQLEQDTVYSKPDYQHDAAGKAVLEELQRQISDKQALVEQLKARLSALEESLSRQTAEPPAAEKPATPPQP
jgi:hypothetical protein